MTSEVYEQPPALPDPWETAMAGLQMAANSEAMADADPYQAMLLTDAEGHLRRLGKQHGEVAEFLGDVYTSLLRYGLHTDNIALMQTILPNLRAFGQYDELAEIRFAMNSPGEEINVSEEDWSRWAEQARQAAGVEVSGPDYNEADTHYTWIAKSLAELGPRLEHEVNEDERRAIVRGVRNELIEIRAALADTGRGRLDVATGRPGMLHYLEGRFNRLCGESGMWREMLTPEITLQHLIYKAADGQLEPDERANLVERSQAASSDALNTSAILALDGSEESRALYRERLAAAETGLFFTQGVAVIEAFRWAAPDLWAESVGRPRPLVSSKNALERFMAVGDPSFGRPLREAYADVCLDAASGDPDGQLFAFIMALHMSRGNFIVPNGEADIAAAQDYQEKARAVRELLELAALENRDALESTDVPAHLQPHEIATAVRSWANKERPYVDEQAELLAQLSALEMAYASDAVDHPTLKRLLTNVRLQWSQLEGRDSQRQLMAEMRDVATIIQETADARVRQLETPDRPQPRIIHTEGVGTIVEVVDNKELGEPYL